MNPISNEDTIIFEFKVLWDGWECDSSACVCERLDGSRYLCMTNHGCEYEASPDELIERIVEYETTLTDSKHALSLLKLK